VCVCVSTSVCVGDCVPGYTQCDVHLSSAGEVEGVERHLGGGLANGLRGHQPHRLARVAQGPLPLVVQEVAEAGRAKEGRHGRITTLSVDEGQKWCSRLSLVCLCVFICRSLWI
jgi:hypothetical protein